MLLRYPIRMSSTLVLLLATCALLACSTMPHRSATERAADAQIVDRVQATLLADPDIYARHIDVNVNRGVVHLGGFVWESADFTTARRDAASVPGAKSVVIDMELMRGGVAGTGR